MDSVDVYAIAGLIVGLIGLAMIIAGFIIVFEQFLKVETSKLVQYDRIELVKKSRRAELIADLEERLEIKRNIQSLKKYDKSLERKKDELIRIAQEAQKIGTQQQYQMAVNNLKVLLNYQKRSRSMLLQFQMAESMRDFSFVTNSSVKALGKLGKAMNDIGVTGMTVTQVMGCGIEKGAGERNRP